MLGYSEVKFVLFGIKEDIVVLANHAQAGAKNTWEIALKSLLNHQSNHFTNPSNLLILEVTQMLLTYLKQKLQVLKV